jgi:hypothetical protein
MIPIDNGIAADGRPEDGCGDPERWLALALRPGTMVVRRCPMMPPGARPGIYSRAGAGRGIVFRSEANV